MLIRKPRIGERLDYDPTSLGSNFPSFGITVTKFDGNIMHFIKDDGDHGQIIWKFSDGLNQCLSHKDAA